MASQPMPFAWPANYVPGQTYRRTDRRADRRTDRHTEHCTDGGTEPAADALWFVFRGSELLLQEQAGTMALPRHHTLEGDLKNQLNQGLTLYLGELDGTDCHAGVIPAENTDEGWRWIGLRQVFGLLPEAQFALAGRALQLLEWDRSHRYCGACGTATVHRDSERSRECPACALVAYPRLSPAVMCLVRRGDQLLLARSPRFPAGMYSALAGFVEPGETLEQCVQREVLEEVGIHVGKLRYFASQSWPFPHSLMIAFFGEYESGEITVDGIEIEAAAWFSPSQLPPLPANISIARKLIEAALMSQTTKQQPTQS
jgi:NAD+ diphosphatase